MNNTDYLGWQVAQGECQYTDEHRRAVSEAGGMLASGLSVLRACVVATRNGVEYSEGCSTSAFEPRLFLLVGGRSNCK